MGLVQLREEIRVLLLQLLNQLVQVVHLLLFELETTLQSFKSRLQTVKLNFQQGALLLMSYIALGLEVILLGVFSSH
jgi:hypothetical protein